LANRPFWSDNSTAGFVNGTLFGNERCFP